MYRIKDDIYPEAGYYLLRNGKPVGLKGSGEFDGMTEVQLSLDDMTVGDYISFDRIMWRNPGIRTYADAKKCIIQKRYSNDDQIAIMLNRDDDPLLPEDAGMARVGIDSGTQDNRHHQ